GGPTPDTRAWLLRPRVRWLCAAVFGMAAAWFTGTVAVGLPVGLCSAAGVAILLGKLRNARDASADRSWLNALPYCLALMAAVLKAGAATPSALCAVGSAVGGRLGSSLKVVGAAMMRGEAPPATWRRALGEAEQTEALLRTLTRSADSGAALAEGLRRLANTCRESNAAAVAAAAQRSSVWMVAPLMCCFLPAFVLFGVVPVVMDVLQRALGGAL
ncbi:MAG: type II secretion system F family protein, partial [Pseudonocardiaceae bacterium]